MEDEIVEEVRQVRLAIEKDARHDISELYERALEIQNELKTKLVSEPLPQLVAPAPNRA